MPPLTSCGVSAPCSGYQPSRRLSPEFVGSEPSARRRTEHEQRAERREQRDQDRRRPPTGAAASRRRVVRCCEAAVRHPCRPSPLCICVSIAGPQPSVAGPPEWRMVAAGGGLGQLFSRVARAATGGRWRIVTGRPFARRWIPKKGGASMTDTVYRQCNLCEAHCGIRVDVEDGRVARISGDPDDVISKGYICPKAAALADLQSDPDRLRRPVKRIGGALRRDRMGRGPVARRRRAAPRAGAPRRRRARHLSRQPGRALLLWPARVRAAAQAARLEEQLLGHLDRPAAAVHELARDVRPLPRAAGARHRARRAPDRDRRQPGGVERLADDRPGRPREDQDDPRSAAARSSWSTRAAPRPPSTPPSTSPCGPAGTPTCCSGCCT